MKRNKIILLIIVLLAGLSVWCGSYPLKNAQLEPKQRYKEADYVNAYCSGQIEYELPDRTRVDCLTDEYAIEFDWAKKWAEAIGQSLYYAKMTSKTPAIALIVKKPTDRKYIERIKTVDQDIKIFVIRASDYKTSE